MMMLGLLAILLGLASAFDLRQGEVPLLLLVSIPALGAVHVAFSPNAPEWSWRAAAAMVRSTVRRTSARSMPG